MLLEAAAPTSSVPPPPPPSPSQTGELEAAQAALAERERELGDAQAALAERERRLNEVEMKLLSMTQEMATSAGDFAQRLRDKDQELEQYKVSGGGGA